MKDHREQQEKIMQETKTSANQNRCLRESSGMNKVSKRIDLYEEEEISM